MPKSIEAVASYWISEIWYFEINHFWFHLVNLVEHLQLHLFWTLIYASCRLVILHAWFLAMNDYGLCKADTFNSLNFFTSSVAHKCQQLLISVFFFSPASHLALTFFLLPDFSWLSFIWKTYLCRKTTSFSLILVLFFFSLVTLKPEEFIYVFVCLVICQSVWTHGAVGDRALQFLFGVSWQRL